MFVKVPYNNIVVSNFKAMVFASGRPKSKEIKNKIYSNIKCFAVTVTPVDSSPPPAPLTTSNNQIEIQNGWSECPNWLTLPTIVSLRISDGILASGAEWQIQYNANDKDRAIVRRYARTLLAIPDVGAGVWIMEQALAPRGALSRRCAVALFNLWETVAVVTQVKRFIKMWP